MLSEQTKTVARQIGEWAMAEKNYVYNDACELIRDLRIHEILVVADRVIIKTERPGVMIGKRGTRIESLEKHLGKTIHIIEAENELEYFLMPDDPTDYDYDQFEGWALEQTALDIAMESIQDDY